MRKISLLVLIVTLAACSKSAKNDIDVVDTWKFTRCFVDSCVNKPIFSGRYTHTSTTVQIIADRPESEMKQAVVSCKIYPYINTYYTHGDTVVYSYSYAKYQHN